ncbi:MAG: hypothetical protein JGK17_00360 [Microcoleus sp. PH2017_10_PVI_O_A]|uniref:hypothetical protein n=1 Tax=unclassified Microcoleus TaxID=2642155 RepID=UPI001D1C85FF|nr:MULTISPECIES: hypothetical protein [unclassified Microcoleus]MCC3404072.1 hypothetical protein [Microcoleus sp. PH2017_10_PVI_O_A]MCC3458155.1 hypothetical protein [Microcoleus sp. PH2017_11_PCY_U_A]MCC3476577.1 hypothetical protein [Microcoleus sp. PH2017_12_PCY_D_A]MCC3527083.1 hypothetical protein [Microcoleus sp. PH2017_21_RUC_O_A]MCC3539285.1 hypothetical protein [Microcoleus sp. PH2017_22_RUC_O_B]
MTQKELDEKELLEILELTRDSEQKAREMCQMISANTAKYQKWSEAKAKPAEKQKQL